MFSKNNNSTKRGFSKTEFVVVSSVSLVAIAIAVAFVVGGLNGRANDSRMIEGMKSLRKDSEIFYLTNDRSYGDFCSTESARKMSRDFRYFNCYDNPSITAFGAWAAESRLASKEDEFYCVDYTGKDGFTKGSTISHEDFSCDILIKEQSIEGVAVNNSI